MIIIDKLLEQRAVAGKPIRVGMVGCGAMGAGILRLVHRSIPGMRIAAIANRTVAHAVHAYEEHASLAAREVNKLSDFDLALQRGEAVVTDDAELLCRSAEIDVVLEVTGRVEYGAQVAQKAMTEGKCFVTMNVEMDATVGPLFHEKARSAGLVFTNADGDQPGVEMNLFRFVTGLGMEPLVCGNIKGLQDHYRTPETQKGFAEKWQQDVYMVTSFADGSKVSMEQAIVANATGMSVAKRGMIGLEHRGHIDGLTAQYDIAELRSHGGIVEYVLGAEPGPGVFVMAVCEDEFHQRALNLYKRGEGPMYCFYRPYHLCYFEVPNTIARAFLCGDVTIQSAAGPMVDVVTTAKKDLRAGEKIDAIGGFTTYGQCEKYSVARAEKLLPMGLAEGCSLRNDIKRDAVLTYDDVVFPEGRLIDKLRSEQNARWT